MSKNEDAAAKAEVAADKASEQAKNQIVAKSKMSKAEKTQQKKEKACTHSLATIRAALTRRNPSQAKAFNNTATAAPKKAAKNSGRWN